MNREAAIRRAGALAACWPGRMVAEPHVLAWAEELARWPDDVVQEALDAVHYLPDPPSVGHLHAVLREVAAERARRERPALPEVEATEMPPEVRERLQALRRRWAEGRREE